MYVQVLVEAHVVEQRSLIGFTPGKYNCFINLVPIHCKNVRVIITLVWSSQLHLFRGFYYTRMITVYKPHIEILIATFCFQNW